MFTAAIYLITDPGNNEKGNVSILTYSKSPGLPALLKSLATMSAQNTCQAVSGTHECVSWPYVSHFFPMCRWLCVDPIWGVCQCWYTLRSKWQVEVSIRSSAYGHKATVHSRSPSPWVIIYRRSYLPVVDPEETAESDSGMTIGENARKKRCGIDSPPSAFWITLGSGKRLISQRRFRNGHQPLRNGAWVRIGTSTLSGKPRYCGCWNSIKPQRSIASAECRAGGVCS